MAWHNLPFLPVHTVIRVLPTSCIYPLSIKSASRDRLDDVHVGRPSIPPSDLGHDQA